MPISHRAIMKVIAGALLSMVAPALALDGTLNVHDPSTVAMCDGKYYVFGTGRNIPILSSADGFTWTRAGSVFGPGANTLPGIPDSVKQYVPKNTNNDVWAPDIIKINGEYYLYYSISFWGEFNSAVGLLTNPTLDPKDPKYKWTDKGMIVHSTQDQKPDLNAIDPGIFHDPNDGKLWLAYGSYHGNIELVELDPKTGLRIAPDSKVTIISTKSEATDLIYHDGYYYLLVNHGSCCKGADSTYNIRMGRSKKVTGPYLDKAGEDLAKGAGTLFLDKAETQIGPGHFGTFIDDGLEKFSCHYEADTGAGGRSVLDIRPLLWKDGWPMPGENLKDGKYDVAALLLAKDGTAPQPTTPDALGKIAGGPWSITLAAGGYYKITAAGKLLEAQTKANDKTGEVAFAADAKTDNQLWKIDQTPDGSFRIASKINKLALTAAAPASTMPVSALSLQPWTDAHWQKWQITANKEQKPN